MLRMFQRTSLVSVFPCGLLVLALFVFASAGKAQNATTAGNAAERVKIGFSIAPVPLNLAGKDRSMVGLGSYLVNAAGGCNDCHSSGPEAQYLPGHNPFFGQQAKENPQTYLGGGRNFGSLIPGSAPIISRNLTPDKTGRAVGGDSFGTFLHTIRTGHDPDQLHPNCTGAPNSKCIPRPFDGSLLQIMPWPIYKNLSVHDLRAIYVYLSAVPCVQGNYPGESPNRCQ